MASSIELFCPGCPGSAGLDIKTRSTAVSGEELGIILDELIESPRQSTELTGLSIRDTLLNDTCQRLKSSKRSSDETNEGCGDLCGRRVMAEVVDRILYAKLIDRYT